MCPNRSFHLFSLVRWGSLVGNSVALLLVLLFLTWGPSPLLTSSGTEPRRHWHRIAFRPLWPALLQGHPYMHRSLSQQVASGVWLWMRYLDSADTGAGSFSVRAILGTVRSLSSTPVLCPLGARSITHRETTDVPRHCPVSPGGTVPPARTVGIILRATCLH